MTRRRSSTKRRERTHTWSPSASSSASATCWGLRSRRRRRRSSTARSRASVSSRHTDSPRAQGAEASRPDLVADDGGEVADVDPGATAGDRQPLALELRQGLPHGHPGDGVPRHQVVLARQGAAGLVLARADPGAQVVRDPAVLERLALRRRAVRSRHVPVPPVSSGPREQCATDGAKRTRPAYTAHSSQGRPWGSLDTECDRPSNNLSRELGSNLAQRRKQVSRMAQRIRPAPMPADAAALPAGGAIPAPVRRPAPAAAAHSPAP